jgi:thioredoxin-related protein
LFRPPHEDGGRDFKNRCAPGTLRDPIAVTRVDQRGVHRAGGIAHSAGRDLRVSFAVTLQHRSKFPGREHVVAMLFASLLTALVLAPDARAQDAPARGAGEFTVPAWFKNSFLDLKEDAVEAGARGKRLFVYVGQDGCPYCAALFNTNFSQKHIVDYTREHFDAIDINMWGDRPVTDFDGEALTEKTFAAKHGVGFTPTILFFDAQGKALLRINGYYPPRRFIAALRYVAEDRAKHEAFGAYLARVAPQQAAGALREEPFFEKPPYDFGTRAQDRPIAVFFEQRDCDECDELHVNVFSKDATREQLARFRVVQLDRWSATPVTTPDGQQVTARSWADRLGVGYVPTAVFFDQGKEVFRIEAMLKAFHVQSVMDYVASGAYRTQPSFQRFIQGRAERLRERGVAVDLWK